jgi:hypothetical protein
MTKGQPPAPLSTQDRARLEHDININADTNSKLYANWIRDAVNATTEVANGNTDLIPVFRIKLYGVMAEILAKLTESQSFLADRGARPEPSVDAMIEAIKALAASFDRDELIYIQYLRNTECHPVQDAYRIRRRGDGSLKDWIDHHLLPKGPPVTIEETRASVRRVLVPFGWDEHAVARFLAHKAAAPLVEVQLKSFAWCGS